MVMPMILMAKSLLFLSCTFFSLEVCFVWVFYLYLDYIISFYISLVSSEFITASTMNCQFSKCCLYIWDASTVPLMSPSLKSLSWSALPLLWAGWTTLWYPGPFLCLFCVGPLSSSVLLIPVELTGRQLPENNRERKHLRPCISDKTMILPSYLISSFSEFRVVG